MRLLFALGLSLLYACGTDSTPASAPFKTEAERSALADRLLLELAPATDRAGRQRNAIVNRAIDQGYDARAAPEGYFYEILEPGEYEKLAPGDLVTAHYRGSFLDGTVFDDSRQRGRPLRFVIGELIPAWNLGLQQLRPGGSIRILTPSSLAYGAEGLTGPRGDTLVPAHRVLEFLITDVQIHEE